MMVFDFAINIYVVALIIYACLGSCCWGLDYILFQFSSKTPVRPGLIIEEETSGELKYTKNCHGAYSLRTMAADLFESILKWLEITLLKVILNILPDPFFALPSAARRNGYCND